MHILNETDVCWESGLMTRRALSPNLTADHTMADLPTSRAQFFSRAPNASGRFFMFFCGKSERESETEMRGEGLWESIITIKRGEGRGRGRGSLDPVHLLEFFAKTTATATRTSKGDMFISKTTISHVQHSLSPFPGSCTTTTLKIFLLKIRRFDWGRQHEDRISLSGDRLLVRIIKSSQHTAKNKRLSFLARPELYNCIVIKAKHCGISPGSSFLCLVTGNRPRD